VEIIVHLRKRSHNYYYQHGSALKLRNTFRRSLTQPWTSAGGLAKGAFAPLEFGTKNQNFVEDLKSEALIPMNGFNSCIDSLFAGMRSHRTRARFSAWCHAVVRFQFTRVHSFSCRGWLRNWQADCFIVGLYCVTITWQQIFKGSVQVTVVGVLPTGATPSVFPLDLVFLHLI